MLAHSLPRRGAVLVLSLLLAGCIEDSPLNLGPPPGAIEAPAVRAPAVRAPEVRTPALKAAPFFQVPCGVQAPAKYQRAVRAAINRTFAWGHKHDGECWAIGTATAESQWDPNAVSHLGYVGIFQLGEPAAEQVGVTDRYDPLQNIAGGIQYLGWSIRQWTKSQIPRQRTFREAAQIGSVGFNWGIANSLEVQRRKGCRYYDGCFEQYVPDETRTYVKRIATLVDTGEWFRGPHHD